MIRVALGFVGLFGYGYGANSSTTLEDGTRVEQIGPYELVVMIPSAETIARHQAARAKHEARAMLPQRKAQAVQMKRDDPSLTYTQIARAVKASPSSVSKWIRAA